MAGLSRSEYQRSLQKKSSGAIVFKFLWRVIVLALVLTTAPVVFALIAGFFMVSTIVLGNWKMSIDLPDYK